MAALQMVPAERRTSWRMHTVENGETLATIGKRYRTPAGTIAAINKMESVTPTVGDRLLIPASYHETAPARVTVAKRPRTHHAAVKTRKSTAHRQKQASRSHVRRAAAFTETSGKLARAHQ